MSAKFESTAHGAAAARDQAPRARRKRATLPPWFHSVGMSLALLVIWEVGVRVGGVPIYLLPPPSTIAARIVSDFDLIATHSFVTFTEVMIGFGLSIIVSVPLAALLFQFKWLERALYPLLVASQTVPKVAIAPLLVVWFGFGLIPKILIAFLICFFPIVIDTLIGFRSVSKEVIWLSRSMGAPPLKTFFKIQIPAALPNIFAGVKVASTLAVVGAVVGEFVGADSGLGYQLIVANGILDIQLSFAVLIVLSFMGIALFAAVDVVERLVLPWHISQRRAHGGASGGGT